MLAKNSNTDYDTEWVDPPTGGVGGGLGALVLDTTTSVAPDVDTYDTINLYSLTDNVTFVAPTGTPADNQKLVITIYAPVSDQTITWTDPFYVSAGYNLPTLARTGRRLWLCFLLEANADNWHLVGLAEDAS